MELSNHMVPYNTRKATHYDISEHITDAVMARIGYSFGTTARIGPLPEKWKLEDDEAVADMRAAHDKASQQAKDHNRPIAEALLAMSRGETNEYKDKDVQDAEICDMIAKMRAKGDTRATRYLEANAKHDRANQRANPVRYSLQEVEHDRCEKADKLLWETEQKYQPEEERMLRQATSEQQSMMTEEEANFALTTQDLAIWDLVTKRYRDRTSKDDEDDEEAAREAEYRENKLNVGADRDMHLTLEERVCKSRDIEAMLREQKEKRRQKFHPIRNELVDMIEKKRVVEDKNRLAIVQTSPSEYEMQERQREDLYHRGISEEKASEKLNTVRKQLEDALAVQRMDVQDALNKLYNEVMRDEMMRSTV